MTEKTIDENIKEAAKEETSAAFAQTARIANALDEHCMPSQFKKQIEDECAKEYEELGLKELKELIEADRKTEPSSSEIPNNCETCKHYKLTCDLFSEICKYEPKDEPTISKMEQVDKDINVRSKDEPQTDCPWR